MCLTKFLSPQSLQPKKAGVSPHQTIFPNQEIS